METRNVLCLMATAIFLYSAIICNAADQQRDRLQLHADDQVQQKQERETHRHRQELKMGTGANNQGKQLQNQVRNQSEWRINEGAEDGQAGNRNSGGQGGLKHSGNKGGGKK